METTQGDGRPFTELSRAVAYLLGGMLLVTTTSGLDGMVRLMGQLFGVIFIVSAFFMAISSLFATSHAVVRWANKINQWLFLALFFTALANLILTAVESPAHRGIYVALAATFFLIILAVLLRRVHTTGVELRSTVGPKLASIRLLTLLAVVLSLFAFAMVIAHVSIMGGPLLYVTIALSCLSVAFALDKTA